MNKGEWFTCGVLVGIGLMLVNSLVGAVMVFPNVVGYSLGEPYCLKCIAVHTKLLRPKPMDMAFHVINGQVSVHRVLEDRNETFLFEYYTREGWKEYTVREEQVMTKVLFVIPWRITTDFREACIYEHKMYGISLEYCEAE